MYFGCVWDMCYVLLVLQLCCAVCVHVHMHVHMHVCLSFVDRYTNFYNCMSN